MFSTFSAGEAGGVGGETELEIDPRAGEVVVGYSIVMACDSVVVLVVVVIVDGGSARRVEMSQN
jgi:hypothetical protein